jgi:hypothetical protein
MTSRPKVALPATNANLHALMMMRISNSGQANPDYAELVLDLRPTALRLPIGGMRAAKVGGKAGRCLHIMRAAKV